MSDLPENPAPRTSVLIAEDKPVFRQLLAAAISRMGVDTETVSNGDKAYERAQRGGVDFLSLYYEMPFALKLKFWSEERGANGKQNKHDLPPTTSCTAKGFEIDGPA